MPYLGLNHISNMENTSVSKKYFVWTLIAGCFKSKKIYLLVFCTWKSLCRNEYLYENFPGPLVHWWNVRALWNRTNSTWRGKKLWEDIVTLWFLLCSKIPSTYAFLELIELLFHKHLALLSGFTNTMWFANKFACMQ